VQLKDVGASLRRHWVPALVILLLIPLVVAGYLLRRNPVTPAARYTNSADILIPSGQSTQSDVAQQVPPVLLQGQVELALSQKTKSVALAQAHLDANKASSVSFSARLGSTGTVMTLAVSAQRPEDASAVLDEYVVSYAEGRRQSVLDAAVERQTVDSILVTRLLAKQRQIESQLAASGVPLPPTAPIGSSVVVPPGASGQTILLLFQRNAIINEIAAQHQDYANQTVQSVIPADYTTVLQRRAAVRVTPPPPSPVVPVLEIIGVGLLLAVAVPVIIDRFDRSITDTRTASTALRARVLGSIPAMPRRLHSSYASPGSSWDGAFRSLAATSISTDSLPQAIMVTSPKGTIHDTVAANFAAGLARLGVRVALIGTVPRQGWFVGYPMADVEETAPENGDGEDIYAGTEPGDEEERSEAAAPGQDETGSEEAHDAHDAPDTTDENVADTPTYPASPPVEEGTDADPEEAGDSSPTLVQLLEQAQSGQLPDDLVDLLATIDVPNLHVVPPNGDTEYSLDGLPPLLDALSRGGIDTVVIAGPALLEDPNATIIAWSTRNVLWALEMGHVDARDAQLAADRLEIAGVAPFGIAVVNRLI